MSGAAGWMLHTLAGGGALLLLTTLAMARVGQPARRQRLGEWGLGAALLLAFLGFAPAWLVIPVALPAPTGAASLLTDPAPDARAEPDPASADVWLLDGTARLAPPLGEPATPPIRVEVPPSSTADWGRLVQRLLLVYFAVSGLLLVHWLIGYIALTRLLRRATPAPESVYRVLQDIVGDRPLPRVLVSHRLAVPFSCGLLRPAIVLPARLLDDTSEELRWVLAHEWAHLERRDARSAWLLGLGRALFFALPWYWWLRREIRLSQEFMADAAASAVSRPEDYAQFLLKWAGAPPVPAGTTGVINHSSDLLRRITMLLQNDTPLERRCPRRWSMLAACGLFALGAVGGGIGLRAVAAPAAEKKEAKKDETAKDSKKSDAKAAKPAQRPTVPGFEFPDGTVPPEFEELFKEFRFGESDPDAMQRRLGKLRERMQRALERGERFGDVRPAQPRLGIKAEVPSAVLVEQLDLPKDQGLVVADVMADSAAAKAGLKPNDILLEFAGKPVSRNVEEFLKVLRDCKPNTPFDVVVLRKGKKEMVKGLALPEIKEQHAERPILPRLGSFVRKLPAEVRAGAAGERPAATTVVRTNDEFTAKHRDGACTITVTGKMADGKATVSGIDIVENGQKQHWDNMDQVPAAHREQVKKLLAMAQQGEVK